MDTDMKAVLFFTAYVLGVASVATLIVTVVFLGTLRLFGVI